MKKIIRWSVSWFIVAYSSYSIANTFDGDFLAYAREKVAKAVASDLNWDTLQMDRKWSTRRTSSLLLPI